MYFTPFCGYCRAAKSLLDRRGVPFLGIDVSRDHERRRLLLEATGRSSVPQIFINGRSIGGFDEISALERAGELEPMLSVAPPANLSLPIP